MPRWDDAFLAELRLQSDAAADAVVADLGDGRAGYQRLNAVLDVLHTNADALPTSAPASLQAFWRDCPDPALDMQRLAEGEREFLDHGVFAAVGLLCYALPSGYAAPCLAQVLAMSGMLIDRPYRRLMGVLQMVLDVTEVGGFGPTGKAKVAARKLRLLHAGVRHIAGQRLPGYAARYGTPVNHEDMLGTILGFSLLVIVSLRKLGTPLEPGHEAALFYPWQAFARHMGLPEAWIPRDVADAEACYAAYARRHYEPNPAANPEGVALTAADLGLIEDLLPIGCKGLGKSYMWRLLGPEGAARVGLSAAHHGGIGVAALSVGASFLDRMRHLAGVGRVVDAADYALCKVVFQALIGHAYPGEPAIRVPRNLRDLHEL